MTDWKGLESYPHITQRREQLLKALADSDNPLTTVELWKACGKKGHYGTVYADLRTLCGSRTLPYAECQGLVNAPGYPVVWHSWGSDNGASVRWSLCDAYRAEVQANEDEFNELMKGLS